MYPVAPRVAGHLTLIRTETTLTRALCDKQGGDPLLYCALFIFGLSRY